MSEENKIVGILLLSLTITLISFGYMVWQYDYPIVSQTMLDKFLPWVASRMAINTPYKYWWPVAFVYVPIVTYSLWQIGVRLFLGKRLTDRVGWPMTQDKIVWPGVWEVGFFTFLIVGLLVNFSYGAFYQFFYNYHHLNFITGPLNDVLNGKMLLVDTKAQYGFLNIFLTSWLFKTGLYFSHPNVHFISMIMGVIEYMAVYLIIRVLTKSKLISFLGIILTTALHFYGVFPSLFPSEFFLWPGGSVWRFFPALPAVFVFLWWSRSRSSWAWRTLQLVVAGGVLWNIEVGIPLMIGYVTGLLTIAYLSQGSTLDRAVNLFKQLLSSFGYLGIIMGSYSLYCYAQVARWPDWSQYFYYAKLFNSGFLQRPDHIPTLGYVYLPILIYTAVLIITMVRKYLRNGLPISDLPTLMMLSVYGYGIFRYYLGKQNESDWAAVIIPAAVILVYLYSQIKTRKVWILLIGVVVFGWPITKFAQWSLNLEKHRWSDYKLMKYDPNFNYPPKNRLIAVENTAVPTIPITQLMESAAMIQKYSPNKERVAIIGYFDHVLLMQAERVNLADYYYLHATLYTKEELDEVVRLYRNVPKYIFVDKRVLRQADEYRNTPNIGEHTLIQIFDQVRDKFEFIDEAPMLYVYERINGE